MSHDPTDQTDQDLLTDYVLNRAPESFARLVRRYADLVYSCAVRRLGDRQLAEDVAQATFLLLAQRPPALSRPGHLAGWLLRATRYTAANAYRAQQRRRFHEAKAAQMINPPPKSDSPVQDRWPEISALLDDAVLKLSQADRRAVILRFFQQSSMAAVGAALGVSEEAARQRVNRAVARLRRILQRRGIAKLSAAALAAQMIEHAAQRAPAQWIASAAAGSASATPKAIALCKGAIVMIQSAKIATAAAIVVTLLLLLGICTQAVNWVLSAAPPANLASAPVAATLPVASPPAQSLQIAAPIQSTRNIPEGALQAAAEMRRLIAACSTYAKTNQNIWPQSLADLPPGAVDPPINLANYLVCYSANDATDRVGTPAAAEAVLVENNPLNRAAGGGQLIGFLDGHVEWTPSFDWRPPSRRRAFNVVALEVYESDWPSSPRKNGIAYTFNDPADSPDAPRLAVGRTVMMSGTCFQSSQVVVNPDGSAGIRLISASNMRNMIQGNTQECVNHRLAIILNENGVPHLLGAPLIRHASGDAILLPGPFKPTEAADLVARINKVLAQQLAQFGPPKP